MGCVSNKPPFPDLQTALVVRDEMIRRYGQPMLAYKCYQSCRMWHLTTKRRDSIGGQMRAWNNLVSAEQRQRYDELVADSQEAIANNANKPLAC